MLKRFFIVCKCHLLMFPHNVKCEESKNGVDMGILNIINQDLKAMIYLFVDRRSGKAEGTTPSTFVLQFVF